MSAVRWEEPGLPLVPGAALQAPLPLPSRSAGTGRQPWGAGLSPPARCGPAQGEGEQKRQPEGPAPAVGKRLPGRSAALSPLSASGPGNFKGCGGRSPSPRPHGIPPISTRQGTPREGVLRVAHAQWRWLLLKGRLMRLAAVPINFCPCGLILEWGSCWFGLLFLSSRPNCFQIQLGKAQ